jgi:hypothetical protein
MSGHKEVGFAGTGDVREGVSEAELFRISAAIEAERRPRLPGELP